jgi:hypothetical protein
VKSVEIVNPRFNIVQDSLLVWNIEKLAKPTEEDTTTSEFPFSIEINKLNIVNLSLNRVSYDNLNSVEKIESFNLENLKIKSFDLDATAYVDIAKNDYYLELRVFNFDFKFKNILI